MQWNQLRASGSKVYFMKQSIIIVTVLNQRGQWTSNALSGEPYISRLIHKAIMWKGKTETLVGTAACIESASQLASSSSKPSSSSRIDLLQQIEDLQQQVRELQKKSEQVVLCSQADSILQHKSALTQGPITLDSFQQLDFDDIVNELQVQAPALYSMFMSLGNTKRNAKEDEVTTEQTKAVSSKGKRSTITHEHDACCQGN